MDKEKFLAGVAAVLTDIGWIDTAFYLEKYPDIGAYPLGPARHYVDCGIVEKRLPRADSLLPTLRQIFGNFVRLNLLPDVGAESEIAFFRWVLTHTRQFQSLGGCTENGLRAIAGAYRQTTAFRTIANFKPPGNLSQEEVLVLVISRAEQELVSRMLGEALQLAASDRATLITKVRNSGYFDESYYLASNPDVATSGTDPILHYLDHGAAEKRDPSPRFSSEFYLANNPDVDGTAVNPLLHFLAHGQAEGRHPMPALMASADNLSASISSRRHLVTMLGRLVTDKSIRAVSFDFFDTLVEREHADPHMVFVKMAEDPVLKATGVRDFKTLRVEAERLARSQKRSEVTLSDIYRQLGRLSGLPESETARLAEVEKAAELGVLIARPLGLAILEHARQRKLKLAITSDFYIGKDFLCEVMRRLKIRHDDIAVLVSSESGHTKHHGQLFDHLARALQVPVQHIMHIGDNPVSDYEQPRARGMAAGLIPTSQKLISPRSAVDTFAIHGEGAEAATVHLQAIQRFRQMEVVPGQPLLREAAELGFKILGPVIADFERFVMKIARIQRADQLVFLARDTRLLFDLVSSDREAKADLPADGPDLSYLLVSRQCMLGTALTRHCAITEVVERDYTEFSFAGILRERFLLDTDDIRAVFAQHRWLEREKFARTPGKYAQTVTLFTEYAHKVFPATRPVAVARAEAYGAYLQSVFSQDKAPLLVDIGYRGTTQKALSSQFGIESNAAYFMTWPEVSSVAEYGLGAWTYVEPGSRLQRVLTSRVSLLELLLSDPESGSLKYFGSDGNAVFSENPLSTEQRQYLNTVHRFAMAYARNPPAQGSARPAKNRDEAVLQGLAAVLTEPPRGFRSLFQHSTFEDRFGGTSHRLLGPNWR